ALAPLPPTRQRQKQELREFWRCASESSLTIPRSGAAVLGCHHQCKSLRARQARAPNAAGAMKLSAWPGTGQADLEDRRGMDGGERRSQWGTAKAAIALMSRSGGPKGS